MGDIITTVETIRKTCNCRTTTVTTRENVCVYPDKKKAILDNPFNEKIGDQKILKCKVEIEAEDKFHTSYIDKKVAECKITINKVFLCEFKSKWDKNKNTLTYEFVPEQKFASLFDDSNSFIECYLIRGIDLLCPKVLSILLYIN